MKVSNLSACLENEPEVSFSISNGSFFVVNINQLEHSVYSTGSGR